MNRRWLQWFALAVFVLGIANFMWVWTESAAIGDALQGRIENGHYLLVNKGTATEVSREAWEWSRLHTSSILVTHPLALIAGFYLVLTTWPQFAGVSIAGAAETTRQIRATGPVVESTRLGARLGRVSLTAPLVRVDIHPGGVLLTVFGSPAIGIRARSIISAEAERSRLAGRSIRIVHSEPGVPADIRLYRSEDDPIVSAVRELVAHAAAQREGQPVAVVPPFRPEKYPLIIRVAILSSFVVALVLILDGVTGLVPGVGPLSTIWTVGLAVVLAVNVYRFVIRDRDRW